MRDARGAMTACVVEDVGTEERRQEAAAILAGCTAGRMDVAAAKSRRAGTPPGGT